MQEFRRFVRGPVGKVLLAAIILPFVISGFYGYFTGGGGDSIVAEVEGNKITRGYVNSRTQQLRQMLRQQSPDINPSVLDSFIRPRMVLEGIVNEQLVVGGAQHADMAFSDVQAARLIRANPAFAENGRFSETRFEQMTRAQGMTPRGYLEGLRQESISQQYRDAFASTDFALPGELAERRRLGEQSRDIRYVRLDLDRLRGEAGVSDQEIEDFYQQHSDDFMRPEQLRIQYVVLAPELYRDRVEIDDEQIQAEYEARKQMRQDAATRRQVAHVLIAVDDQRDRQQALARAEEARQALQQGQSFAQVASEYSDDAATVRSGGQLGMLEPGDLPESLDQALAALEVGEVSEPVDSDAGIHLLKLETESKPEMASLEEMRDDISADLRRSRIQVMLSEDLAVLEELLYEHSNLEIPSERLNLAMQTTNWVAMEDLPAVLDNDQVREALNSTPVREQGHNSELLELGGERYVAVRLRDVREPEPLSLAEVSDDIRARIRLDKARDRAEELAGEARAAAGRGADLEELAGLLDAEVTQENALQRGMARSGVELSEAAFATPRPAEGEASEIRFLTLRDGDLVAFRVTAVRDGGVEPLPAEQQRQALRELASLEGERSFAQVMAFLRDSLSVKLYPERLARADDGF